MNQTTIMTTKSPQELAASLRAIHGAKGSAYTATVGPVFAIYAMADRLADLELAAAELELLAGAYERGFNDRIAGTDKAQLLEDFQHECDAADEVMRLLGLDPQRCRTEGGAMNMSKVRAMVPETGAKLVSQPVLGEPIVVPVLHIGACITDGQLYTTVMRLEADGALTVLATAEMNAAHLEQHDCLAQMAPALTRDKVREAALAEKESWKTAPDARLEPANYAIECLCERLGVKL